MPPLGNVCSTCGTMVQPGELMKHINSKVHQDALREKLDSPLTNVNREPEFKEGDRRNKTGSLGGNKDDS